MTGATSDCGSEADGIREAPTLNDVTRILSAIEQGDPHAAADLLPLVYDELRKLASQKLAREPPGQTLQATALVHEAYLRLVGERRGAGLERPRSFLRRGGDGHAAHPDRTRPPEASPDPRRHTTAAGTPSPTSPPHPNRTRICSHSTLRWPNSPTVIR